VEPLEPRVLLSGDASALYPGDLLPDPLGGPAAMCEEAGLAVPDLEGLDPIGLTPEDLAGQVVVLDMDGAEGVVYRGPVTVGPFDVAALDLSGPLAGQGQALASRIVAELARTFAGTGLVFTTQDPGPSQAHSTVYITAGLPPFKAWGQISGLAERVDLGNRCVQDQALVFAGGLAAWASDLEGLARAIAQVAAHEVGHLVGYVHTEDAEGLRSGELDPGAYGSLPSQVAHDAGVDSRYVTYSVVRAQIEAANTYVHQWITQQAVAFYQSRFAGGEIAAYLGTIRASNDDAWYPVDTTEWSQFAGDDLLEGVYEEDTLGIWMRHFVAGGDGAELATGLDKVPADDDLILETLLKGAVTEFITDAEDGRYLSAYEAAEALWDLALDSYRQGDKALAYYHLGRVAHLVADMTVPAHVHLDRHAALQDDGDFYEKATSTSMRFLSWGMEGERGGPVGQVRDYAGLEDPVHRHDRLHGGVPELEPGRRAPGGGRRRARDPQHGQTQTGPGQRTPRMGHGRLRGHGRRPDALGHGADRCPVAALLQGGGSCRAHSGVGHCLRNQPGRGDQPVCQAPRGGQGGGRGQRLSGRGVPVRDREAGGR